jgi:hypothetical protein
MGKQGELVWDVLKAVVKFGGRAMMGRWSSNCGRDHTGGNAWWSWCRGRYSLKGGGRGVARPLLKFRGGNGVVVEEGWWWEGTDVMVDIRLLFVCSVGCCLAVDERMESEVRRRQTKKLFRELSQVSLSNPLHVIAFQGLFASLRCEICWLTI